MTAPTPSGAPGAPTDGGTGSQAQPETQQPQTTLPASTGQQPTEPGAPAEPSGQQQGTPAEDVQSLPPWAQKVIGDLRTEAASHRTGKKSAETQLAGVLKALGKNPDGTDAPADPEQLVERAQSSAWKHAVENQVLRLKDIDASKLLDSMAFVNSLDPFADEDPNTSEFRTKIAAHVQQYVKDNPGFKATPAGPARSGGEFPGGAGAGTPITEDQLKSMSPEQIAKALAEGKLQHLL